MQTRNCHKLGVLFAAATIVAGCATTSSREKEHIAENSAAVAHFYSYIYRHDRASNMLRVNVKFVNRGDFTLRTNAALDLAYITTTDGRKHFFDIASNTELYSGVVVAPGQSSVAVLDRMKVPKTFVLKNIKRISVFLHDNGLWFTGVLQPEHFQPLIRS